MFVTYYTAELTKDINPIRKESVFKTAEQKKKGPS